MATHILLRRDTASNWTTANPVLQLGEPGVETDTARLKVGDGVTVWTALPYLAGGSGGTGGAVSSVNSKTGAVVLAAADVGADAAGAAASAVAALPAVAHSGAYTDLTAKPTIPTVGAAGAGAAVALSSTDASVTNARTPSAHAATHGSGGSDPISVASTQVTGLGTAAGHAATDFDPAGAASAAQAAAIAATSGQVTDAAMASALGASTATAIAGRAELKAAIDAEGVAKGWGSGGGSGVNAADAGYDVVLLMGQSNMTGSNTDFDARTDPADGRVFSYEGGGTYGNKIAGALDPMYHNGGAFGVGPGFPFARWYSAAVPTNRKVLLVATAASGTPLVPATGTTWNSGVRGSLYDFAVSHAQAALTAAGANARIVAALWAQGESDSSNGTSTATPSQYQAALDALIARLRSDLSLPNLPFLIGGMVPEYIATAAQNQAIAAVHASTPTRVARTAYVAGTSGYQKGDFLHYNAAGQRVQGRAIATVLPTAVANTTTTSVPAQVAGLTAGTPGSGTVPLSWSAVSGATFYLVEQSTDAGTTWTTAALNVTGTSTTVSGLTASTAYSFRVTAANAAGYGTASAPVNATTAAAAGNTAPGQVTGLTAGTPTSSSVPLSWTAPASNGGAAITDYVVQYRTTAGPGAWQTFADGTSATTSATLTGLTASTGYDFQVAAVNSVGTGTYSPTASATTAASAPAAAVSDSFNRADNATTLGTADTGQAWATTQATGTATWGIAGNRAYTPSTGTAADTIAYVDSGLSDCTVQATLTTFGSVDTDAARVVWRLTDGGNYWMVQPFGGNYTVYKRVTGTFSGVTSVPGVTPAQGDVITVVLSGNSVTVKVNGGTGVTITDTFNQGATKHGIGLGNAGGTSRWDDFSIA